MTFSLSEWRGGVPRIVLLAMVMSLLPLRVAAAQERSSPQPRPIKASLEKIAATDSATARTPRTDTAARAPQTGRDSSFFKTKPGIIALVVMAAGAGYALYSASNDRITSPGKQ